MAYKQLSVEERETIQKMRWEGHSVRAMAKELGRSASSISREIKRNRPAKHNVYAPRLAQERALAKRKSRGRKDRLKNEAVRTYVVDRLKLGWSPEQIANTLPEAHPGNSISHEAIYQYVYAQVHRNGWGLLKPGHEDLRVYLRRKRKRRQRKGMRRSQRLSRLKGPSIDDRPGIVQKRKRIGDWESDTVESRDHLPGVNTLLERKSGLFLVTKVSGKGAQATVAAIARRMKKLPRSVKQTITFDNGSENSSWQALKKKTGLKPFFAHPYCSWERGSNENANGLLREYFPKGTDFTKIPEKELRRVEYLLNTRPRKRLAGKPL